MGQKSQSREKGGEICHKAIIDVYIRYSLIIDEELKKENFLSIFSSSF